MASLNAAHALPQVRKPSEEQERGICSGPVGRGNCGLSLTIMKTKKLAPIHPGEILREEFMKPLGLSQNGLARALNIPPRRINEIVPGKARHHGGHGVAPGALFRHHRGNVGGVTG